MEVAGYIGALLMGLTLGLIGGGGSILSVPILVYLFHVDTVLATAYSLFIVGTTALFGSAGHIAQRNVDWRIALVFGIPSIAAVFATRTWIMPTLPSVWLNVGAWVITKEIGLLLLFALLMVAAAYTMIRPNTSVARSPSSADRLNVPLVILEGTAVGMLTGLVGAGGGFLIIPALVILAKLPMKKAIATSLMIIAAKSLIGFTGDLSRGTHMDWPLLLTFTSIAVLGILLGTQLGKRIPNEQLKPAFGWFVLVMGVSMIAKELAGA
jgi:uncharacterized protein